MRFARLRRIWRTGRRVIGCRLTGGVILLYHRVVELPSDPQALAVSPRHFEEHLQILGRAMKAVSLDEMVRRMKGGESLRRTVAVTFDDGYADNLRHAKPLLERYGVPATVFVASGTVGRNREFWWDELERILLAANKLPKELELTINGQPRRWSLGADSTWNEVTFRRYAAWSVLQGGEPTRRHQLYRSLCELFSPLLPTTRDALVQKLRSWAGVDGDGRASHRSLTREEIVQLAEGKLVDVGAHTVNHPALAHLPVEEQRREIEQSKQTLERIVGRPVCSFSYPFGYPGAYSDDSRLLVQDAGFRDSCANFPQRVHRKCDPYQLPRFLVRDWNGDEFERHLKCWNG